MGNQYKNSDFKKYAILVKKYKKGFSYLVWDWIGSQLGYNTIKEAYEDNKTYIEFKGLEYRILKIKEVIIQNDNR